MKNAKSAKIKLVKSKDGNSKEIAMQLPPMSDLVMRNLGSRCHRTDCPTCFVERHWRKRLVCSMLLSSGFPSTRTNLSPFTKDFRGGELLE